jgi:predicted CoA-binding protein
MSTLHAAANEFLTQRRLAVVGVSRDTKQAANLIYRTFRERDYDVFAVNPKTDQVEGGLCYASLADVHPKRSRSAMRSESR